MAEMLVRSTIALYAPFYHSSNGYGLYVAGQRSREVYLPSGRWEDFWDGDEVYEGPTTITVDAPLDRIPVFVREGADVPGRPE